MIILGIETSCDETAAAVIKVSRGKFFILSSIVSSQISIHKKFGGVVPELAARNHVKNILPVIGQALSKAKVNPSQIDKIAVASGPGLVTSLIVGVEAAKTLAYALKRPIADINHVNAHIYSNWLTNPAVAFPALALIVSGGHTELILMKSKTSFKKVGQTLDDAAGEAFDKAAQLLNIGYPGGPIISKLAKKGDPNAFKLPRPMISSPDFNFSFSGLKTALLYTIQKLPKPLTRQQVYDLSASFQHAIVETLISKTIKAAIRLNINTIILAGGVAANEPLRNGLKAAAEKIKKNFLMPNFDFCTDNAAMTAAAGYFAKAANWQKIKADPNLEIK